MSAACVCPEMPAPDRVGAGPIVCGCCGQPLVITCPGECGESHVRQSIAGAMPKAASARAEKKPRVYKPKPCQACGTSFTPTGPRDNYCQPCRRVEA